MLLTIGIAAAAILRAFMNVDEFPLIMAQTAVGPPHFGRRYAQEALIHVKMRALIRSGGDRRSLPPPSSLLDDIDASRFRQRAMGPQPSSALSRFYRLWCRDMLTFVYLYAMACCLYRASITGRSRRARLTAVRAAICCALRESANMPRENFITRYCLSIRLGIRRLYAKLPLSYLKRRSLKEGDYLAKTFIFVRREAREAGCD